MFAGAAMGRQDAGATEAAFPGEGGGVNRRKDNAKSILAGGFLQELPAKSYGGAGGLLRVGDGAPVRGAVAIRDQL